MRAAEAAPLVGGSVLGVVLFPMLANHLAGNRARTSYDGDLRADL
jgi:hypothetical protein